ncbi:hypothetical protein [Geitlerinema sp. PCC 9228]|nr:hypothetical protein [Geitlerinema sp. PCC 9228]
MTAINHSNKFSGWFRMGKARSRYNIMLSHEENARFSRVSQLQLVGVGR